MLGTHLFLGIRVSGTENLLHQLCFLAHNSIDRALSALGGQEQLHQFVLPFKVGFVDHCIVVRQTDINHG
ncbi:hypothetical protein D3C84_886100 [compost metagenome]